MHRRLGRLEPGSPEHLIVNILPFGDRPEDCDGYLGPGKTSIGEDGRVITIRHARLKSDA
jgi:hypothetical protein